MDAGRKRRYRTWKGSNAGRCRNCGTVYIPSRSKGNGHESGDVEEMEYCEQCTLRCPSCEEWLPGVDVQVQGWWTYYLSRNDETERFQSHDYKAYDEKVLHVQCPRCGKALDPDLFQL